LGTVAVAAFAAVACTSGGTTPTRSLGGSSPSAAPPIPPRNVRAVLVATLDDPLDITTRAGDDALYVVTKTGKVYALRVGKIDRTPALDLSGRSRMATSGAFWGWPSRPTGGWPT
jgi:hypothetical protein